MRGEVLSVEEGEGEGWVGSVEEGEGERWVEKK